MSGLATTSTPYEANNEIRNIDQPQHLVGASDPALATSHQHHHEHLHHSGAAILDEKHSPAYTIGTTIDSSAIPNQNEDLHRRSHDHIHGEKGTVIPITDEESGSRSLESASVDDGKKHMVRNMYVKYKWMVHLLVWLLSTAWWVVGLVLHRKDRGWLIPFLLYLCITIRIVTFYVPASLVMKPAHFLWDNTALRILAIIPEKARVWSGAALVIAVFLIGSFASPESEDNTRENRAVSIFGLIVFIFGLWLTSNNRKMIVWHTVIVGMLIQFIIALFVLRTKAGFDIFNFVSGLATDLLEFARDGVAFLTTTDIAANHYFFFSVLPAIIFFVSFVQLLFYWGLIQWFIGKFAVFFYWSMRVSGSEAVVAAASPFIGQGESAMLIKPFIAHMTLSEIHQIMCSGFATIAGSVLVAYIGMGVNSQALLSSCVMSIPASLAASKLRYPETEESLTRGRVVIPDDDTHKAANAIHAFAEGAWLGLKIAGMILSTLLCIIALLGLANGLLGWWGHFISIPNLSIELIVGYICYPIAFLLGVPRGPDIFKVAKLIGTKLIANEFVAYNNLQTLPEYENLLPRSRLIATYALCGFANIGSLGTQIGVLSQIAPSRGGDVSRLAFSALITGAISTFSSANIAGMLVTNQKAFFSGPPPNSTTTA